MIRKLICQNKINKLIINLSNCLSKGYLIGKGDTASSVIIVDKGVTLGSTFRTLGPYFPKNIVPVHIDWSDSWWEKISPCQRQKNIKPLITFNSFVEKLIIDNQFGLVLIDSMEQLYKKNTWKSLDILRQIAETVDDHRGRISLKFCTNYLDIHSLVTNDACIDKLKVKEFPLLKRGLNLNDSKLRVIDYRTHDYDIEQDALSFGA